MLSVLACGPGSVLRTLLESHGVTSITGDWANVRTALFGMLPDVSVLAVEECLCAPNVLHEFRSAGFEKRLVYVARECSIAVQATAKLHDADVLAFTDLQQIVRIVTSPADDSRSPAKSAHRVVIDALEVDRRLGRLWISGIEVGLTRRPWQALDYLLQHRGRIVSALELGSDAFQEKLDASTVRDHLRELRRRLGQMAKVVQSPRRGGYLIA